MKNTIKLFSVIFISSFLSMGGCVSQITTVNFDYPTETTIETVALNNVGPQTFGESVLTSSLKAELEKNNTSLDLLDELKLKSVAISFTNDSTSNFNDIENMEFYLAADGNPEVLIASKNLVLDNQNTLNLDINNSENLANYLKATTFTYRIKGTNSAVLPAKSLNVKAIWTVKASAK
jgi:hypothetical protein